MIKPIVTQFLVNLYAKYGNNQVFFGENSTNRTKFSMLSLGKKWESKNQEHGNLWVVGFFEGFFALKRLKIGVFSS